MLDGPARSILTLAVVSFGAALTAGCDAGLLGIGGAGGGSSTGSGATMSGGTTSGFGQSGSTGSAFSTGSGSTGSGMENCSEESKLVYVFSSDNQIYSFDPPAKKFTLMGSPDYSVTGSPNSMAVDRDLNAWINYIGSIHVVPLGTLDGCTKAMDLPSPYQQIGMGFATNAVGTTDETLFIDGIGGGGLAKIDTVTKTLTPIGGFANDPNLAGQSAELTGTGDARLYGYFTTSPYVRVAEIDKSNANILSDDELTGVSPPSSWAFSFWGGALYLYAANIGNSRVIRFVPSTGELDTNYIADVGFAIVGAGVSTCAPIIPPS